jgi:hypothetical protein
MDLPAGIALNEALRENVFSTFVCLSNRIPIIIVGKPGCSKSLSVSILRSNLRGSSSRNEFLRRQPELSFFTFQGSKSCTSEGI